MLNLPQTLKPNQALLVPVITCSTLAAALTNAGSIRTDIDNRVRSTNNAANTTSRGNVELATTTEAATGIDTTRAVTPAGVRSAVRAAESQATTSVRGTVELATTTEAATGTDATRVVTPAGLEAWGDRTISFTQSGATVNRSLEQVLVAAVNRAITDGDLSL